MPTATSSTAAGRFRRRPDRSRTVLRSDRVGKRARQGERKLTRGPAEAGPLVVRLLRQPQSFERRNPASEAEVLVTDALDDRLAATARQHRDAPKARLLAPRARCSQLRPPDYRR